MRRHILRHPPGAALALAMAVVLLPVPAAPLESVTYTVAGDDTDLTLLVHANSLLWARRNETDAASVDVFADAQSEYGVVLEALYNAGYFSPVIHVLLDGREAAGIAPLDAPAQIGTVTVTVDPGPKFTFAQASLKPLTGGTELPPEFAVGRTASTGAIRTAVEAGIDGWRVKGYAKAAVSTQDLTADHDAHTLSASIDLEPGPRLRFGTLTITGNDRMRTNRIRKIAGLTEGETYSSEELARAAERLRRTGIFSSVALTESDTIVAPDLLPISLSVVEAKTRRYSFGVEVSSLEGLKVSGDWLHRNLFGGGERFSIGFEVNNISSNLSGTDYSLGVSLERPASPFPDTTGGVSLDLAHLDEEDYLANSGEAGLNFNHIFSPELSANLGLTYSFVTGQDVLGDFTYRSLNLPMGVTWDRRDNATDATKRFLIDAEVKPFLGFGSTEDGVRLTFDTRGYYALDDESRFILAARIQGGSIIGASALGAPRDELFYSGGGGTVRGQPYQSLGITVNTPDGPVETGGTTFLGGSLEGRFKINDSYGAVAFFDIGTVADGGLGNGSGGVHSGAGLGLRYATGFGPLRFDLAAPVSGSTGSGLQLYVGLGQSF